MAHKQVDYRSAKKTTGKLIHCLGVIVSTPTHDQIPFFSLSREWDNYQEVMREIMQEVGSTQQFIGGKFVQAFEKEFAEFVGSNHAISCNSGTDALWLAFKALDLKKDDIVLTTPFSFIASSSEIFAHGAHPVFIDVDPVTNLIDLDKLELWLEDNVKLNAVSAEKRTGFRVAGILFVTLFGNCPDIERLNAIAQKYKLWTVEDAAQSVGAFTTINGQRHNSGTLADISTFSCYPTKNLGAYGDAGICTTNDPQLAATLTKLKNHGRMSHYNYDGFGINSRMDAIQARILSHKLKDLNERNTRRRAIAAQYSKTLENLNGISVPQDNPGHVYHQYVISIDNNPVLSRDDVMCELESMGVQTRVFYPESLDQIPYLQTDERLRNDVPIAHEACKRVLALPIWPELTNDEVVHIAKTAKAVIERAQYEPLNQTAPEQPLDQ